LIFLLVYAGNIPGPLIFASIVDKSCVYWKRNVLTGNKTCRLYNNAMFSAGLGIVGSSIRFLSACFAFVTFLFILRRNSRKASTYQFRNELAADSSDKNGDLSNTGESYGQINRAFDNEFLNNQRNNVSEI
jgi:hypothetical protein